MHFIQTEICGWDEHAMPAPARREEWSVLIAPSPASFMDVGEVIATTESALPVCHAPGTDVHCTGFLTAIFLGARSCLPLHTGWGRIPSGFPFTAKLKRSSLLRGSQSRELRWLLGRQGMQKRQEASQWRQEVACRLWPHRGMCASERGTVPSVFMIAFNPY